MEEILKVQNLIKYYGNGSVVTKAVDDISFSVTKGEFTAIMGASGSGKSTLLNIIATIDNASSGDVFVDGKNIIGMKESELAAYRRDKLGFIFQDYNLLDTLTVGENITLPLNLRRETTDITNKKLKETADILQIDSQLAKFPCELSGGERQRVACARAIVTSPSLVLADEPTGALDSKNAHNLMKTFCLMNQSLKSTILMVTHDAVASSYASRVLFLKDGKIWSEIVRGEKDRQVMYNEILSVITALGGDSHAV